MVSKCEHCAIRLIRSRWLNVLLVHACPHKDGAVVPRDGARGDRLLLTPAEARIAIVHSTGRSLRQCIFAWSGSGFDLAHFFILARRVCPPTHRPVCLRHTEPCRGLLVLLGAAQTRDYVV